LEERREETLGCKDGLAREVPVCTTTADQWWHLGIVERVEEWSLTAIKHFKSLLGITQSQRPWPSHHLLPVLHSHSCPSRPIQSHPNTHFARNHLTTAKISTILSLLTSLGIYLFTLLISGILNRPRLDHLSEPQGLLSPSRGLCCEGLKNGKQVRKMKEDWGYERSSTTIRENVVTRSGKLRANTAKTNGVAGVRGWGWEVEFG